jgi:hypothetical protein
LFFVRPLRLLGYGQLLLITPIVLALPILLKQLVVRGFSDKSVVLSRYDLYVLLLLSLFLLAIINSLFYNSTSENLQNVFYIFSGLFIYLLVRLLDWNMNNTYVFSLILLFCTSIYTISEFYLYYNYPFLTSYVGHYKQELQGVLIFNIPENDYFIFGYGIKPFGVMMEASSSGALSALLVIFIIVFQKQYSKNRFYLYISVLLGLFAVFFSGSKTAYLILGVCFTLWALFSNNASLKTKLYTLTLSLSIFLLIIDFLAEGVHLDKYFDRMLFDTAQFFYSMIGSNFFDLLVGSGEVGQNRIGMHNTEVDLINSIIRYGVFFVATFLLLMYKSLKYEAQGMVFFVAIIISMLHYSVIFKFPVFSYLLLIVSSQANMNKTFNKLIK